MPSLIPKYFVSQDSKDRLQDGEDAMTPSVQPRSSMPPLDPDSEMLVSNMLDDKPKSSSASMSTGSSLSNLTNEELLQRYNDLKTPKKSPDVLALVDKGDPGEDITNSSDAIESEDNAIKRLMDRININRAQAENRRDLVKMGANLGQSGDLIASGIGSMVNKSIIPVAKNPVWEDQIKQADIITSDADKKNTLLAKLVSQQEELKAKKSILNEKRQDKIEAFTTNLRKELSSGGLKNVYNNIVNASKAEKLLNDAIKNPNGFKDYGALMVSLKALQGDDTVVKEAEMRLGQTVGSILDRVGASLKGAVSGEKMTDNQRKLLLDATRSMVNAAKTQAEVSFAPHFAQADELGIPREKLISKDFLGQKKADEVKESIRSNKDNKPKTVIQNGHTYTLNEKTGEYE